MGDVRGGGGHRRTKGAEECALDPAACVRVLSCLVLCTKLLARAYSWSAFLRLPVWGPPPSPSPPPRPSHPRTSASASAALGCSDATFSLMWMHMGKPVLSLRGQGRAAEDRAGVRGWVRAGRGRRAAELQRLPTTAHHQACLQVQSCRAAAPSAASCALAVAQQRCAATAPPPLCLTSPAPLPGPPRAPAPPLAVRPTGPGPQSNCITCSSKRVNSHAAGRVDRVAQEAVTRALEPNHASKGGAAVHALRGEQIMERAETGSGSECSGCNARGVGWQWRDAWVWWGWMETGEVSQCPHGQRAGRVSASARCGGMCSRRRALALAEPEIPSTPHPRTPLPPAPLHTPPPRQRSYPPRPPPHRHPPPPRPPGPPHVTTHNANAKPLPVWRRDVLHHVQHGQRKVQDAHEGHALAPLLVVLVVTRSHHICVA